jgi:uncharacterized protein
MTSPHRRLARWSGPALVLVLAAIVLPSCGGGGGGGGGGAGDSFNREALLSNLATTYVLPTLEDFADAATALQSATQALSNEVQAGGPNVAVLRTAAQEAWRDAMELWQVADLFQFGPAGASSEIVAGQDLRTEIYSWPTSNHCLIDSEIVSNGFAAPGFPTGELVSIYGLDAVEYLLFHTGPNNNCPAGATINTSGSWNALGQAEIDRRRAAYAAVCCNAVVARAQQLRNAWQPSSGNFVGIISAAGSSGVYASAHAAVNDVFAAMFYLDLMVKDRKLALPAGLGPEDPEPTLVESFFGDFSKEHLLRNLEAFQRMFLGNAPADPPGVGFDDFLAARGAAALASEMTTAIAAAIDAVEAIPGLLEDAIQSGDASVAAAHAAIKTITDNLKSQFVTVLNLSVPNTGAGDND